jgi:hypothetical protein
LLAGLLLLALPPQLQALPDDTFIAVVHWVIIDAPQEVFGQIDGLDMTTRVMVGIFIPVPIP